MVTNFMDMSTSRKRAYVAYILQNFIRHGSVVQIKIRMGYCVDIFPKAATLAIKLLSSPIRLLPR
jgi:hypothetical protein